MKTVLYSLDTPVGTFWIQPQPADRVLLGIGGQRLRTYGSVKAAMAEVSARTTGHAEWDEQPGDRLPISLRQWKKGRRPDRGRRVE